MQNMSRDNLIDQLHWMVSEVKRRPKEAYFAVPEFALVQIDEKWMKQIEKSIVARELKLQKEHKKRHQNEGNI